MGEGSGVLHPPPSLTLLINITKLSSNDSQQKVTSASGLNKHFFTSRCLSVKKSIVFVGLDYLCSVASGLAW